MDNLLGKILRVSGLSEEEIEKFKNTYSNFLGAKILEAIASIDADAYKKLETIQRSEKSSPEELTNALKQISQNPLIKREISRVVDETTEEFVDAILVNINDQEKQEIIATLQ